MDKYLLSSNKPADESGRRPFVVRKAADCNAKGRLLQAKRRPFGKSLTVRCLAVEKESPRGEGFLMVYFERHCPCRLQYSRA